MNSTGYEQKQQFNSVVSWLHSFRFQHIVQVFESLREKVADRPIRVVEIGCAHGKLFSFLNERFRVDYTGIDVSAESLNLARSRHGHHENFALVHGPAQDEMGRFCGVDVVVALETLEHIPEAVVVRIVEAVAAAKPGMFVCSVPVEVGPAVWAKNVGSWLAGYSRHREYTWGETFWAGLGDLEKVPVHGTGHKGFDWRWLAQTVRHNMRVREIRKFPIGFMPAATSSSVFMIAESR
jgi:SAM-dependent methyltransferase